MHLITMQVLRSFTTFLLSGIMSKLRIGTCLLAVSPCYRISIHLIAPGWQLKQSWMTRKPPSTKARPSFKFRQYKAHSSSPATKIWGLKIKICRETEHLKTKIRRNGNPTVGLSLAAGQWERLWWQTSTVTFHTACKTILAANEKRFALIICKWHN